MQAAMFQTEKTKAKICIHARDVWSDIGFQFPAGGPLFRSKSFHLVPSLIDLFHARRLNFK
jgi:hypothetical protein